MATIQLKFRPSSSSEALGTLYYQLIHKRCVRSIGTTYRIYANEWSDAVANLLVPISGQRRREVLLIQSLVRWELERRRMLIRDMETNSPALSVNEIYDAITLMPPCITVFAFLRGQISHTLLMQRHGTARTYDNAYQRFREFRDDQDLTFDELTPDMMKHYEEWLSIRQLRQNTIRFYLRTLHTLLYRAVDAGLLVSCKQLFSRVRLSYVATAKRAISENELRLIERMPLPTNSIMAFARDIFMFSFYMRGMPFVDIAFLKKKDLKNGNLEYCRKKTRQHLRVEWSMAQQTIVQRYAHLTRDTSFMFPIIRREDGTEYRQYGRMLENINRALKKIGERAGLKISLTTYVARHTWASMARDMNFPIAVISEGMGHQSYRTTQIYLNSIDSSRIDDANREIIRRIKES